MTDQTTPAADDAAGRAAPRLSDPERLTAEWIAEMRADHTESEPDDDGWTYCNACEDAEWPCVAAKVFDALIATRADLAAATARVEAAEHPEFTNAEFCRFVQEAASQRERAEQAEAALAEATGKLRYMEEAAYHQERALASERAGNVRKDARYQE